MGETTNANTTKKVFLSSAKMAVATFASRILGLVREQLMAHLFGASGMTDAFLVAYRLPNLMRDLFAEGAFSAAFVPVFTEVRQKNVEESDRLFWSMAVLLALVTGFISLLLFIFAAPIVSFAAPKFLENPELYQATVVLTKIMAPFLFFVSMAALCMGALNTQKIFFIPALAPAFFNLATILCMIGVPTMLIKMGYNAVYAMGIGVFLGGIAQWVVQIPLILKRIQFVRGWKLWGEYPKRIISRLGIGTVGIAAAQINVLVNTILATNTVIGAVSWLTYAFRLFQFPVGMLGVSIAGSNLVHFTEAWKKGERDEAVSFLQSSYNLLLLAMLPAMAVLYGLSGPIIEIIYQRGQFSVADSQQTALAFKCYLLGLPFYGIYKVLAPTFYTLDVPGKAVKYSLIAISTNVAFSLVMVPHWGFSALALGTGLSMGINVILQAIYLRGRLQIGWNFFCRPIILKATLGVAACLTTLHFINFCYNSDQSLLIRILTVSGMASLGGIAFVAVPLLLGEGKLLKNLWQSRRKK